MVWPHSNVIMMPTVDAFSYGSSYVSPNSIKIYIAW